MCDTVPVSYTHLDVYKRQADSMVRKIFTYAKTGDLDNSSDEQRMKVSL